MMGIKFVTETDFYREGRASAGSNQSLFFQMNKVENGWTLAVDARFVDVFDSYDLAIAKLLELVKRA